MLSPSWARISPIGLDDSRFYVLKSFHIKTNTHNNIPIKQVNTKCSVIMCPICLHKMLYIQNNLHSCID